MSESEMIEKLSTMSEQEILNSNTIIVYKAYDLGFLTCKKYTEEQLLKKKQEYLSMTSNAINDKRWEYEVNKYFDDPDFRKCPDKFFLLLDNLFKKGTPL